MKLGDIIYTQNYLDAARFCNTNKLILKELEQDVSGRRWQITQPTKLTEQEFLEDLRYKREIECFSVINRGQLWYNKLDDEQLQELDNWYHEWLDVTETKIIPEKPSWLK